MRITEQDYQQLYAVVSAGVDMAISCFYTENAFNDYALHSDEIFAVLNHHAGFWKIHRYSLQSTFFITLGRVFDSSGDVHSIHTLLNAAIQQPSLFSKNALRARKIAVAHATPNWLDDRINEAWEPTIADLRQFKRALAPHTAKFQAVYAPIRHQVFGHSIVTDEQRLQALFAKALLPEIDALLYFLRDLLSSMEALFYNGTKPTFGTTTYSYQDRAREQVRRLITALGVNVTDPAS